MEYIALILLVVLIILLIVVLAPKKPATLTEQDILDNWNASNYDYPKYWHKL